MNIITFSRTASIDEIAAEMDRRGEVIEKLEAELLKVRPFSSYPEDRETLMSLARTIQTTGDFDEADAAADKLADMVLAILSDEKVSIGFVKMPDFTNPDGPNAA